MTDDEPEPTRRLITQQDLAARHEAQLGYPGSVPVWSEGNDEGEGHGYDNLDTSPALRLWRKVDADPDAILSWYKQQLTTRGWVARGSSQDGLTDTYGRGPEGKPGSEFLYVVIRHPGFGMWEPPGGFGGGTHYEIAYTLRTEPPP